MHAPFGKARFDVVSTSRDFRSPPATVWDALMFYEEVAIPAPFFLRLVLPIPLGTVGFKSRVGSEVMCRYTGGHLLKRITEICDSERFAFEVTEQKLALYGIRLLGGEYILEALRGDETRVTLSTRYASRNLSAWVCGRLERALCHRFHRHLLEAIGQSLAARAYPAMAV